MKKGLLLLASLLVSVASFAQWTKPVPNATDMNVGDTLYLYNKGAGAFFTGANDWGTRASVSTEVGNKVIVKIAYEDEEETIPTGYFVFADSVLTGGAAGQISAVDCNTSFSDMWVDGLGRGGYDMWTFTKTGDHYVITNANVALGNFGVAQFAQGVADTRCYIYDANQVYTADVNGEEVEAPFFSGEFWDEWIFVSPAEYATVLPKVAAYGAAMSLKAALDAAKAEYPSLDFSAPEAVYNSTSSTAEELTAA